MTKKSASKKQKNGSVLVYVSFVLLWLAGVVGSIFLIMWIESFGDQTYELVQLISSLLALVFLITGFFLFFPPLAAIIVAVMSQFEWGKRALRKNPLIEVKEKDK